MLLRDSSTACTTKTCAPVLCTVYKPSLRTFRKPFALLKNEQWQFSFKLVLLKFINGCVWNSRRSSYRLHTLNDGYARNGHNLVVWRRKRLGLAKPFYLKGTLVPW